MMTQKKSRRRSVLPPGTNRQSISSGSSSEDWRAATHASYVHASGTSLPMDCQVVKCRSYTAYPDLTVLKIGEPFFKSLSAFASDPRRHAFAPVNTYSALSNRSGGTSARTQFP